jgi:metal-responsive CopG/Arc/MetJ family transcriptional regulator
LCWRSHHHHHLGVTRSERITQTGNLLKIHFQLFNRNCVEQIVLKDDAHTIEAFVESLVALLH